MTRPLIRASRTFDRGCRENHQSNGLRPREAGEKVPKADEGARP
jgi:hypothetical protein